MTAPLKHPWLSFISLAFASFMICIDFLAIGIAIDPMAKALSIDIPTLQWLLSAFAIGNSTFLVTAGFLADRYGRREIFLLGLIIFVASSLMISVSSSVLIIIIARLFQGVSAGFMATSSISLVTNLYPEKERVLWISGIVGAAGLGMVFGPFIGGLLIHFFSWRMIFLINLPIGLISIFFVLRFIPKETHHLTKNKIDIVGIILLVIILSLLTIGLNKGNSWGWMSNTTLITLIIFVVFLIFFLYWESHYSSPLIEFALFQRENFLAANIVGFSIYFLFTAWILIFGIYLQRVMGLTPLEAGFGVLPFGFAAALSSIFMRNFTQYFTVKQLILLGGALNTLAFGILIYSRVHSSLWFYAGPFFIFGIGFTLVNSNTIPAAIKSIESNKLGIASGKCMMFRWLGGAIGAALTSTVFIIVSLKEATRLANQNSRFSNPQFLQGIHDIVIGKIHLHNLSEIFKDNQFSAYQIIIGAYHHGLTYSMVFLAIISFLSLMTSLIWIKSKN